MPSLGTCGIGEHCRRTTAHERIHRRGRLLCVVRANLQVGTHRGPAPGARRPDSAGERDCSLPLFEICSATFESHLPRTRMDRDGQ